MTTLLRIDASARVTGSHSRRLADRLQDHWLRANPGGRVITRDLAATPPPHLDAAMIEALEAAPGESARMALSDALIAELASATDLLISSPIYNFGLPSPLKAWFDHLVRAGHTFVRREAGFVPRLAGRRAYVVTARGGVPERGPASEPRGQDLREILGFLGWTALDVIELVGTNMPEPERRAHDERAIQAIDRLFDPDEPDVDRRAIDELRVAQARAIEAGDAAGYARLCTEDVCLLIPGHDLVQGQAAFLACETALFRSGRFARFEKTPLRVVVEGDIAFEVGRQRVEIADASGPAGVFAPTQKYTHVFRRTPRGWRFALLMSNACE
ncbi:NAD(P)H-dependent oxidoreductase [Nannocystaceae bacterium ST9]